MNDFFKRFLNIFEFNHKNLELNRQLGVVFLLALSGLITLLIFGIRNYMYDYKMHAYLLFALSLLLSFGLIHLKITKNPVIAGYIGVLLMYLLLVYILFIGVDGNKIWGVFWFYLFPPITIFILGNRKGSIFLLLSIVMTIIVFHFDSIILSQYPIEMKGRFVFSYILVSIMIMIFEYFRKTAQERMIKSNKEKTDVLNEVTKQKKQIEMQKDKLEKKQILMQYVVEKLEAKNKEVTDSIIYAKRIQDRILPKSKIINTLFPENFILFMPKDIVSGDFYYLKETNNSIYFSVIDCTGHGVPGAFMSLIGYNLLEAIIMNNELETPAEILTLLKTKVIEWLDKQDDNTPELYDGMDIAMVQIIKNKEILNFAGAYNPLYIINNKQLSIIQADKFSVGKHVKKINTTFKNNSYKIKNNDVFYMFSDGYRDQLDEHGKQKFYSARFKDLLIKISDKPMQKQKEILEKTMQNFKQTQAQCDDMLVVGFKYQMI